MKNNRPTWLWIFCIGFVLLGLYAQKASAITRGLSEGDMHPATRQQAAQTLIPTVTPSTIGTQASEPRTLPSVGGNAGLVIAASVLVLIILGGAMLSSRRRSEH
ncbi:MAG: hypothetical protein A2136_08090 [Chloroflexi bacterium RBG_16_54_11]|nr:MAG: hypothetical protein A2136_08090 [Chloroflexi bacterium RBG_16_54_11]